MSQIPVLKSAARTRSRRMKPSPQNPPAVPLVSGGQCRSSRSFSRGQAPESASSPRSHGPLAPGHRPSQPLQSPFLRISPLPLPAPRSGKFLTVFVPSQESVAGLRAASPAGVKTRQSVLLALTEMSFFSLFRGSGWGWFVFISWLTFLRVHAVYPHKQ